MDKESRIVFIQAMVLNAYAEIEGMKALNKERESKGHNLAYDEQAFFNIPERYGLTEEQVVKYLKD